MSKLRKLNQVKLSDGRLLSEVFNERKTSPYPHKVLRFKNEDFSFVDFSNRELNDLQFRNCNFSNCDFSNQQLEYLHFKDCNFSHCDFTKASIKDTAFIESDLTKANFTKARLYYNRFYQSNLTDVNFEDVTISGYDVYHLLRSNSNLTNLKLEQLTGGMKVPFVKDLHKKVYQSVGEEGEFLKMSQWHQTCGTTHCRGGWAIHHAGEAGFELEKEVGEEMAASLIYYNSEGMVPNFYVSNEEEEVLEDIKHCASL